MLGCHDFCGYYEWTFHHVRQTFGQAAVRELWAQAIGGESQASYTLAAKGAGLRGLLEVWTKTGEDEQCDWTFTLDEERNVLRWDMRQCPSKGFLLNNDLNADEDYCDHCIGWIAPLLDRLGIEVARHEHNHRGQCWAEMCVRSQPSTPLDLEIDIRKDPRWSRGYVDVFVNGAPLHSDPCEVVLRLFESSPQAKIVTDEDWLSHVNGHAAIVVGTDVNLISQLAQRLSQVPDSNRPLLMHAYFPTVQPPDFLASGLPRPLPILPLLIRAGVYRHVPGAKHLSTSAQVELLTQAVRILRAQQTVTP